MVRLSVRPVGNIISLEIEGEEGFASVELDPRGGFALMATIARAINATAIDHAPKSRQAILKTREPSFAVAASAAGGAVLTIRPDPFPTMEFEFCEQSVADLIDNLTAAANEAACVAR